MNFTTTSAISSREETDIGKLLAGDAVTWFDATMNEYFVLALVSTIP